VRCPRIPECEEVSLPAKRSAESITGIEEMLRFCCTQGLSMASVLAGPINTTGMYTLVSTRANSFQTSRTPDGNT
jgi:hypothetical protein